MSSKMWTRILSAAALAVCSWTGAANAQATGACCVRAADGTVGCRIGTAMQCRAAHGVYRGNGSVCDPNPCVPPPVPTGACCTRSADGPVCQVGPADACRRAGGAFRGPNTTCDPNPCVPPPSPTGACCTRDAAGAATCAVVTAAACRDSRGAFRGGGTTCEPNPCVPPPAPTGACCTRAADGTTACNVVTAAACRRAHGRFRGPNTTCGDDTCTPPPPPPARGACCIPGSDTAGPSCSIVTAEACATAGGRYGGDRSTCRAANCPTTCPCDYTRDGTLDMRDLFAFIHDYMAGNGDFNGDGTTDEADLHAFIDCYRTAPAGCTR